MFYYSSSLLQVEWTNQHGCGVGHLNVDCNIVLQYMCGTNVRDGARDEDNPQLGNNQLITLKDQNPDQLMNVAGTQEYTYGQHETYPYYQTCLARSRNLGLFIADQNVQNNVGATATRQNPDGTQRGFECQEERDYYPYWHPTPWKDIAVLVPDTSRCSFYHANSQNVKPKNYCGNPTSTYEVDKSNWDLPPYDSTYDQYNNQLSCESNGGKWYTFPAWGLEPPDCVGAEWTRDNHLGNVRDDGVTNAYMWIIPSISSSDEPLYEGCVLRLRYNISTDDYPPWGELNGGQMINAQYNGDNSPIYENPNVMFAGRNYTLAVNTNQYGRTFQDRSHTFSIRSRDGSGISSTSRIYNLNVRGKRGNIVQAYPAVEYDFVPNYLKIKINDYVHFQWTGSDRNPQNYEGEGIDGTDRSNIVQVKLNNLRDNVVQPFAQSDVLTSVPVDTQDMFDADNAKAFAQVGQPDTYCTSASQTGCCKTYAQLQASNNAEQDPQNCGKLNAAPAYFEMPPVRFSTTGTYHYYSTRNNNFSNRSQKGTIQVDPHLGWLAAGVVIGGAVAFVIALVIAIGVWYSMAHPGSAVANIFQNV